MKFSYEIRFDDFYEDQGYSDISDIHGNVYKKQGELIKFLQSIIGNDDFIDYHYLYFEFGFDEDGQVHINESMRLDEFIHEYRVIQGKRFNEGINSL